MDIFLAKKLRNKFFGQNIKNPFLVKIKKNLFWQKLWIFISMKIQN